MNLPLISIIIPCYNHGLYIREALESIEKAKDKYPVEVIIVNDGSTDEYTLQVFKELEQEGYFVLHQNNGGLGNARNSGIRLAKGKYILPLDSDNNVLYPYLNDAINILENDDKIDIIYGDALYIGEKQGIWKNKSFDKDDLLRRNYIDACAVYRKNVWEDVNMYAEDMPFMGNEDWNFWIRCLVKSKNFYYLSKNCFEYRVLSNSMIHSIPYDFDNKCFLYNVNSFPELYRNQLYKYYYQNESIFYGSIFRKLYKMTLNHLGLYDYYKSS